jgi:hypothetical protein
MRDPVHTGHTNMRPHTRAHTQTHNSILIPTRGCRRSRVTVNKIYPELKNLNTGFSYIYMYTGILTVRVTYFTRSATESFTDNDKEPVSKYPLYLFGCDLKRLRTAHLHASCSYRKLSLSCAAEWSVSRDAQSPAEQYGGHHVTG